MTFWDCIECALIACLIFFGVVCCIFGIATLVNLPTCNSYGRIYGIETKYEILPGVCFVKVNDEYIPLKSYENRYKNGYNIVVKEDK